jgi:hypothetical protein
VSEVFWCLTTDQIRWRWSCKDGSCRAAPDGEQIKGQTQLRLGLDPRIRSTYDRPFSLSALKH